MPPEQDIPPQVKEVIDLSVPMTSLDTPVYPGYPQPLRATFTTIRDNGYSSFIWTFAEHSSTHVDAPSHFSEGAPSIDSAPIWRYVGHGLILDFSDKPQEYLISREDISSRLGTRKIGEGWLLFFYTGYSDRSRTDSWLKHPRLSQVWPTILPQPKPKHPHFLVLSSTYTLSSHSHAQSQSNTHSHSRM